MKKQMSLFSEGEQTELNLKWDEKDLFNRAREWAGSEKGKKAIADVCKKSEEICEKMEEDRKKFLRDRGMII